MGMSNRLTVVLQQELHWISVLHSSFSDGVQLGKIIGTAVCSEATTDFLFYLDFPNSPLTGIIQKL